MSAGRGCCTLSIDSNFWRSGGEARVVLDLSRLPEVAALVRAHKRNPAPQTQPYKPRGRRLNLYSRKVYAVGRARAIYQAVLNLEELRDYDAHRLVRRRDECFRRFRFCLNGRLIKAHKPVVEPAVSERPPAELPARARALDPFFDDRNIEIARDVEVCEAFGD